MLDVANRPWFTEAFHGILPGRVPFAEPRFGDLVKLGVITESGRVQRRINVINEAVFLTDGPWRQHRATAVYPFEDEATILLRYARTLGNSEIDAVVELAAGCGHAVIAHPCQNKYALDVNSRARRIIAENAALNSARVRFWKNDIRDGLPTSLLNLLRARRHVLFLANMPFAVSPRPNALPPTADGGLSGNELTLAAVRALGNFEGRGTALLLTNSLYNSKSRTWQIRDDIHQLFPAAATRWHLDKSVRVWRINGKRSERNPMRVRQGLPLKAECQINVADSERVRVRDAYRALAAKLEHGGWDKLGCGVLAINLGSQ